MTSFSPPMPAPFLIARSITSRDTLARRAFSTAAKSRAIAVRIGAAHFRRDHHFLHQLAGDLAFLETGDFSLRVQPLATHAAGLTRTRCGHKRGESLDYSRKTKSAPVRTAPRE